MHPHRRSKGAIELGPLGQPAGMGLEEAFHKVAIGGDLRTGFVRQRSHGAVRITKSGLRDTVSATPYRREVYF
jgi:hypothetical protein